MQLGKALIGAIIGAAVGIGLLFAVHRFFQIDHIALSIGVALLTGLGVRTLVSTSGHASYARGALTGILALAAYVGGWFIVAEVAKATSASAPKPARVVAVKVADTQGDDASAPAGEAAVVEQPARGTERSATGPVIPKATPGQNPLDFVWLGIAALVAYELGRGTGSKPVEAQQPTEPEEPAAAPAE